MMVMMIDDADGVMIIMIMAMLTTCFVFYLSFVQQSMVNGTKVKV